MSSLSIEGVGVTARDVSGLIIDCGADYTIELAKRVNIPINCSTTPAQIEEMLADPWLTAGKYGLGWVYFSVILLLSTTCFCMFNYWNDKIRCAQHKEDVFNGIIEPPFHDTSALPTAMTYNSTRMFFPPQPSRPATKPRRKAVVAMINVANNAIAFTRYVAYRPTPALRLWRWRLTFPSPGVVFIIIIASTFSMLYCFVPRPLFFSTMAYGSPPLAIRAGMLSVALLPWIVLLASKVNLISYLTGIGSERLVVLHRWGAYICMTLAVIHAVPFWWQSARDPVGFGYWKQYFTQQYYIFTTGIAAAVPLAFLFFHSLPILRHKAHEVFAVLHVPVSWIFIGMMFWHCNRFITSWSYLWVTFVFMLISLIGRLFYLNWSVPTRASFLIGEESSVTILTENAVKITIPTQKRWKPGQYAYIRMPGIALLDNHPFTIASLCSEDFPSDYGEEYRNMMLVFRPFGGFTKKVLDVATAKGPLKTYRAFIEGPYGGMRRQISSFDQVIFFAGGSGITAITSQLLDLIKRMRDGKAVTTTVHVIWAMKRPEIMDWFKEELRICREHSPPGSVHCNFYITSAKRYQEFPVRNLDQNANDLKKQLGEKLDEVLQGVASKRNSRIIQDLDIMGGVEQEITALPQAHLAPPPKFTATPTPYFAPPPAHQDLGSGQQSAARSVSTLSAVYTEGSRLDDQGTQPWQPLTKEVGQDSKAMKPFDLGVGFSDDPTPFQKSLMRFAFLPTLAKWPQMMSSVSGRRKRSSSIIDSESSYTPPAAKEKPLGKMPLRIDTTLVDDGWRTEYGRPDISFTLRKLSRDFGKRTCVFVCGPPEMRIDVARTVAELQKTIWQNPDREELYLHTDNYAI